MSVMETAKPKRRPAPYYTTTVDVDISAAELEAAGWHHENECEAVTEREAAETAAADAEELAETYRAALVSLHHQAHGPGPAFLCRAEPCFSLSVDQLRGAA